MSSQLSLFGESEILMAPSELVAQALPLVAHTIDEADPEGTFSDLQAAHVAVSALKRAATRFDPSINDWGQFAIASMKRELRRAMERGHTRHQVEVLADRVFAMDVDDAQEGDE